MSSPSDAPPKTRRTSFLDKGGRNSLSNFASSYTRAQSFVGSSFSDNALADEISPCTLHPDDVFGSDNGNEDSTLDGNQLESRIMDTFNTFHFPDDENTPLMQGRKNSRVSRSSIHSMSGFKSNSTAPQTIFNAVNTLMGIAMLSLLFGFRLAGWVVGSIILVLCAWTTLKTAKILGSIMKKHRDVITYGDIAYLYGGPKFQALATCIFMVDLIGAAVLLVLLFSDSFSILFPQISPVTFKVAVVATTFVFLFLPLAMISLVSVTGILCTVAILVLITVCGFISSDTPGSLLSPASTYLWPQLWPNVLLSLGVFMAPWGGHPVFPELYRDMRHPQKFDHCCNVTFLSTFKFDYLIAVVGFLMFGSHCEDTLTKNIMKNGHYPHWVNPLLCTFLGVLPISKLALIIRPIVSVYESHFHMNDHSVITYNNGKRVEPMTFPKFAARLAFVGLLLCISLVFTSFGKVIAFLGSAICFTICMTFPLMFHMKLNADELTKFLRIATIFGIAVGALGAISGTYASFTFSAI